VLRCVGGLGVDLGLSPRRDPNEQAGPENLHNRKSPSGENEKENIIIPGVMSCDWLSAVPPSKADGGSSNHRLPSGRKLFVTRFRLSPGAPLRALVEGQDILIIGVGDGELANETKSPPTYIDVRNGAVVLMPKEEPYRWRNIGKQDVELLAVDVRR
jgi:hypothetical protein